MRDFFERVRGFRSHIRYGQPGCDVSIRRNNYFVICPNPIPAQNENQGAQAVTHPYAMPGTAVSGKLGFESLDFFAKDIPTRLHDAPLGGVQFPSQLAVRSLEVKKGYAHWVSPEFPRVCIDPFQQISSMAPS